MGEITTWVGIDDHRSHLDLAVLRGACPEGDAEFFRVATDEQALRRVLRRLVRQSKGPVVCGYEAGPLGYTLRRWIERCGARCEVAAPALTPKRPGQLVKTNRRDAAQIGAMLRSGMLTLIQPPSEEQEAVRDLVRLRDQQRCDLQRSRHRLQKFLLRRGLFWRGKSWTKGYEQWLRQLSLPASSRRVLDEYWDIVEQNGRRLGELDQLLIDAAAEEPYRTPVGWLRCFRGIDTLTAMGLTTTFYSPERFPSCREAMSFVGLTSSESSTGERQHRGPITRQGNPLARRLLVEAAWHQRLRPQVSAALAERRKGQPKWVIDHADVAMRRLHRRFCRLTAKGKPKPVVVVAVARELVGFTWPVLVHARINEGR